MWKLKEDGWRELKIVVTKSPGKYGNKGKNGERRRKLPFVYTMPFKRFV
ncbi:MAG: hypothetical protein MUW56_16210 [Chryseobacterium sp.]|nr:hypothetical protein [Chryseobacterium sp.]MCJ7935117.1 hypothetical protein [Chryseobacterium sp.]